jgi:2-polyprenyl-3-methyl-5-hydroxy-6-metoxy-1,4-benzoquinol methylase
MSEMSDNNQTLDPAIESVRSYWNKRPCNIRHSPRDVGSREYFDEVEQRKYFVEPHIPDFAQFARWRGKRVLEIGCGIGTDAVNFARHGADYATIELSQESIALAKRRFGVYGLEGTFVCGNAEDVDGYFSPGSFDLIYSFGVIHHTPHPRLVVEGARKLIKDDGELRVMLYARNSWKAMMIDAGLDQPEAQGGCPIALTFTSEQVAQLLDGLFDVQNVQQDHIFPFVVEKYVRYEYELQPWFKCMPDKMFKGLQKRLGWHLLVTAKPSVGQS